MANEIAISSSSRVSVRRQIAVQIAARILSGELTAGRRLPSGRAMARRLRVHRSVVAGAYRQLSGWGLVRTTAGSGAFVAGVPTPGHAGAPSLRFFLESRRARGSPLSDTADLLRGWLRAAAGRHVIIVERETALRRILARELQESRAGRRIQDLSLADVLRSPASVTTGLVVARSSLVEPLQAVLPPWVEVLPIRFRIPAAELLATTPSRGGCAVALCTRSRCVADFARDLLASEHGDRVGLIVLDPGDAHAVRRARRTCRWVFSDTSCAPVLMRTIRGQGADSARVRTVRIIAPRFVSELSRYLGAPRQSGT